VTTILLTGATGNTGRIVAERLRERGHSFVGMARSAARRDELARKGFDVVLGDFDDPEGLVAALEGIERAYLVCTPDERLIPREVAFIRAAKRAGVRRIVKCSAFSADLLGPSQNLRAHAAIEGELIRSGLEYTIVRPHGFMQTFTMFNWPMIEKAGAMSLPAGDGGIPLIDVRDVAEVVVRALTEPGHERQTYDLTGPEVLDMYAQAQIIAGVLGQPVRYIPGNERGLALMMRLFGVPPTAAEHALVVFKWQREHRWETTTSTLSQLGIAATSFEQFVRDLVEGRTGGGNSFEPRRGFVTKMLEVMMPVAVRLRLRFDRGG
jgi:uncharacterized protein YbjT (DUF2867 family)